MHRYYIGLYRGNFKYLQFELMKTTFNYFDSFRASKIACGSALRAQVINNVHNTMMTLTICNG